MSTASHSTHSSDSMSTDSVSYKPVSNNSVSNKSVPNNSVQNSVPMKSVSNTPQPSAPSAPSSTSHDITSDKSLREYVLEREMECIIASKAYNSRLKRSERFNPITKGLPVIITSLLAISLFAVGAFRIVVTVFGLIAALGAAIHKAQGSEAWQVHCLTLTQEYGGLAIEFHKIKMILESNEVDATIESSVKELYEELSQIIKKSEIILSDQEKKDAAEQVIAERATLSSALMTGQKSSALMPGQKSSVDHNYTRFEDEEGVTRR